MENVKADKNVELKTSDTTEDFQLFITNLFEKNGVLNDLRAYLRRHIVTFLRSVENGDIPQSQEYFTQRLQLKFQAINAVIAEYLMKLKFGYTCSVFISEVPLTNMVFDFTKDLFENSLNNHNLHFSPNDIFQILNYLGLQSDKEHIMRILEEYQRDHEPLLMCILKNVSLHGKPIANLDKDSLSIDLHIKKNNHLPKCKHYEYCELCQNSLSLVRERSKKKKKHMVKNGLKYIRNNSDDKKMAKTIKVIEKKLIEEMFEQLKNVYEGEIEILREESEKKVKRSLAEHASLMQKHRLLLEQEMESRRIAMEAEFRERRDFVADLAATLKDAHEKLRDARQKLKKDAEDLLIRENGLKFQLQEAEETLKVKGEEMQKQITHELKLLDDQQQKLTKEKNAIQDERQELENLKKLSETTYKLLTNCKIQERDNLDKQFESMRNELDVLKKYIMLSNECKLNQDTVVGVNNNKMIHDNDDRVKVHHVVNDIKKLKNVNFSQTVPAMYNKWCQHNDSDRSKCVGTCLDSLKHLRLEHEKLQEFSKQQSSHIELLSLSLRQINEANTCTTSDSAPQQKYLKEVCGENIFRDNVTSVPQKSTHLGNTSANEMRDEWNTSQGTTKMESQGDCLKDKSSKRLPKAGDLLRKKSKYRLVAEEVISPNRVVKEAKLRLRKLEIEAEAVERSYLKFKQQRSRENRPFLKDEYKDNVKTPNIDTKEKVKKNFEQENQKQDEIENNHAYEKICRQTTLDFDKYLRKYYNDDKSTASIKNCNKVDKHIIYNKEDERRQEWNGFNYLETPLVEFRKLYQPRSNTLRAPNKTHEKKLYKIDSNDMKNENFDLRSVPGTSIQIKSKEAENINALSKDKDMHIKYANVQDTHDSSKMKIPNISKDLENNAQEQNILEKTDESNKEYSSEINKISLSGNDQRYAVEVDDITELNKNDTIIEATKEVQKIRYEDSVAIIVSEDNNKSGNKNYINISDPTEEHDNGSFDENSKDINKINVKETTEALTEEILKESGTSSSGASKDLSDHKAKTSDLFISVKPDILMKHVANAGTENTYDTNLQNENGMQSSITPAQGDHTNSINENNVLTKAVSPKEKLKIITIEEQNVENSNESKHSEAEYEADFSIPSNTDNLSDNKNNSQISIPKSSEEENFWE